MDVMMCGRKHQQAKGPFLNSALLEPDATNAVESQRSSDLPIDNEHRLYGYEELASQGR